MFFLNGAGWLTQLMHFVTSKPAIADMARCTALEPGDRSITSNAIMPRMMDSEANYVGRTEQSVSGVIGMQALKGVEKAGDLMGVALFMASPPSGSMTGQSVQVG